MASIADNKLSIEERVAIMQREPVLYKREMGKIEHGTRISVKFMSGPRPNMNRNRSQTEVIRMLGDLRHDVYAPYEFLINFTFLDTPENTMFVSYAADSNPLRHARPSWASPAREGDVTDVWEWSIMFPRDEVTINPRPSADAVLTLLADFIDA